MTSLSNILGRKGDIDSVGNKETSSLTHARPLRDIFDRQGRFGTRDFLGCRIDPFVSFTLTGSQRLLARHESPGKNPRQQN
jgi:hypothetical protein